jgi:hypothetical protein
MDPADRIITEFYRLHALGRDAISSRPIAEQIVYHVVAARCEIDINGFASLYEQLLNPPELDVLINGLIRINEPDLAAELRRGFELLKSDGFYDHMNWIKVSPAVKAQIDAIGKPVGDRLWELDGKLAALLDNDPANADPA